MDIAAPGTEILSLRAIQTDLMQFEDKKYVPGTHIIGTHKHYYRLSGTSFAAPYVAGVASLLLSVNPGLTAEQVKRMILHSAKELDIPGVDKLTGYGLLDAAAALKADPEFFVEALIESVGLVRIAGKPHIRVIGTVDANKLNKAWVEIGAGESPTDWKKISGDIEEPVITDVLGDIPAREFQGAKQWNLRIISEHKNGRQRENRFVLRLD